MKKLVALVLVVGLFLGVTGIYSADAAKKKIVKKKAPIKKVVKPAPKRAPAPVAPAPMMPAPVAPAPVPAPVVAKPVVPAGLFGLGINTDISLGYNMGKSVIVGRANLVLDDPMALAAIVGLKADSLKWKVGLGGATGNDKNNVSIKAIPLFFDGVLNLPADWFGGVETYIGGGLNYTVYGSGKTSGKLGGEAYVGLQGDLGMGGKSFAELGYGVIRSNTLTAQGLTIAVGQEIKL